MSLAWTLVLLSLLWGPFLWAPYKDPELKCFSSPFSARLVGPRVLQIFDTGALNQLELGVTYRRILIVSKEP